MSTSMSTDAPFLDSVLGRMNGFLYRCKADKEFTMLQLTSGFERCFGIPAAEILENSGRMQLRLREATTASNWREHHNPTRR